MQTATVDAQFVGVVAATAGVVKLNGAAEGTQHADGGVTVPTVQKAANTTGTRSQRAQHDRAVADRLVAGDAAVTAQGTAGMDGQL
mgnify:CR=1 FL=1